MMTSPKLGHVAEVYGFISTSINLIGTKLHKIETTIFWPYFAVDLFQLGHMTSVYGFISSVINAMKPNLAE